MSSKASDYSSYMGDDSDYEPSDSESKAGGE
jgi:hypothetical protein